jgi:hypothetical protein
MKPLQTTKALHFFAFSDPPAKNAFVTNVPIEMLHSPPSPSTRLAVKKIAPAKEPSERRQSEEEEACCWNVRHVQLHLESRACLVGAAILAQLAW